MDNLPAYLISGAALLFTLGKALYDSGRNRGFQEHVQKEIDALSGLPSEVKVHHKVLSDQARRLALIEEELRKR